MSADPAIRFPGESGEYRLARNRLLAAEIELRRTIERVAAQRRALPPVVLSRTTMFSRRRPIGAAK